MSTISTRARGVVGVARLPFLTLPVVLGLLGGGAAVAAGSHAPLRTVIATVGLVAAHAAVNALNEAHDYESGIDEQTDRTPFSGGSGTIPAGQLTPRGARAVGAAGLAVAAAVGSYFLVVVGPVILPVIALGLLSVVGYTPAFTRFGLGEAVAGLGLGTLPVVGIGLVQPGALATVVWAAAVPPFFLTFDLLLLNEFPDLEADEAGGRANLVHRLGRPGAARLYVIAALGVPVSISAAVALGVFPAGALVGALPTLLLVRPVRWALRAPGESVPLTGLRDNVLWVLTTNGALAAGLAGPTLL